MVTTTPVHQNQLLVFTYGQHWSLYQVFGYWNDRWTLRLRSTSLSVPLETYPKYGPFQLQNYLQRNLAYSLDSTWFCLFMRV